MTSIQLFLSWNKEYFGVNLFHASVWLKSQCAIARVLKKKKRCLKSNDLRSCVFLCLFRVKSRSKSNIIKRLKFHQNKLFHRKNIINRRNEKFYHLYEKCAFSCVQVVNTLHLLTLHSVKPARNVVFHLTAVKRKFSSAKRCLRNY